MGLFIDKVKDFLVKVKNSKGTFYNYFMRILLNRQRDERNFLHTY